MTKRVVQIALAAIAAVTLASCIIIAGDGDAEFTSEASQTQEN